MSEYTKIEKDMYSKDPQAHIEVGEDEYEKFADQVAKVYHKVRQKEWQKAYIQNYRSRFGKKDDKSKLDMGVE